MVFDLDGTLIDSVPLFATLINGMLEDRDAPFRVTEADTRPHATAGGVAMIRALLGDHCGPPDEEIAEFRRRYAAFPTPADSLYPGVRDALAALEAAGIALAVWSNKTQPLCEKIFADLGLTRRLAAVVGTSADVPLKPDTTGLDRALFLAGSDRAHACFVGDSDLDHEAARRAGVPFVMVTYGYGDYVRPWPGAVMVDDFAAVPGAVSALLGGALA